MGNDCRRSPSKMQHYFFAIFFFAGALGATTSATELLVPKAFGTAGASSSLIHSQSFTR